MKEVESLCNLEAYFPVSIVKFHQRWWTRLVCERQKTFFDRELENETCGIRGLEETRPDRIERHIRGAENRIPLVRSLIRSFGTIHSETTCQ
jgi:hypothetical protein